MRREKDPLLKPLLLEAERRLNFSTRLAVKISMESLAEQNLRRREGVVYECIGRLPAEGGAVEGLRKGMRIAWTGVESVKGDAVMGDGMFDASDFRADLDFEADHFLRGAGGAFGGGFARIADHTGKLPEAAPQTMQRALRDKKAAKTVADQGGAVRFGDCGTAGRELRQYTRIGAVSRRTVGQERTAFAFRIGGRADQRTQLHQSLVEIAWMLCRHQLLRQRPEGSLIGRRFRIAAQPEEPAQDTDDVGIDQRTRHLKRDRQDRPRGIPTDTRQGFDFRCGPGKLSAKLLRDHLRGAVQIAGAGVVAEPRPVLQNLLYRSHRQRFYGWKSLQKPQKERNHRRHLRLLQHDLRNPDRIGSRATPGQITLVRPIPGGQPLYDTRLLLRIHHRKYRHPFLTFGGIVAQSSPKRKRRSQRRGCAGRVSVLQWNKTQRTADETALAAYQGGTVHAGHTPRFRIRRGDPFRPHAAFASAVGLRKREIVLYRGVIERYRALLPVSENTPVVTLCEGNTPLIPLPRLAAAISPFLTLYAKYEGLNPTGSFKDRGMTMAVTKALEAGQQTVMCASTGNTSAAAAAYAARAGMGCYVLIPEGKIALGKLSQALIHGAKVLAIAGNFDEALCLVREICAAHPIALVNSVNPVRIEGQKTAAFEVVDALGDAPDFHALPVGNAGNITAYWRGYQEYYTLGKSTQRPKMLGFQAAGAAPIVTGVRVLDPDTIATAIRIGNPAGWHGAVAARDESGGRIDSVTDTEILEAYQMLPALEGIFAEPACAAPIAGLRKLAAQGYFTKPCTGVLTLTGHGLKDPDIAVQQAAHQPIAIPATREAVLHAIGY